MFYQPDSLVVIARDFVEMKAILRRMDAPSLFGAEIKDLAIDAEMQTSNRLHFKVHTHRQTCEI